MIKILLCCIFSLICMVSAAQNQSNCKCCTEEYRQFDFWLGEWTVTNTGNPAGTNSIKPDQDSCVIVEQWTSASGTYTGTSYNYYDPTSKKWYQSWVDNQGASLRLSGTFYGGSMILMDEPSLNPQGVLTINKVSWTPQEGGTVRQHWETSEDMGKSWTTVFDGIYSRKL